MSSGLATHGRGRGRHTGLVGGEREEEADPFDRAFGAWPPPRVSGAGDGRARVYIRGEETYPGGDTMVLGGLFQDLSPAGGRDAGPPTEPMAAVETERRRTRRRYRLAALFIGIGALTVTGYLAVPPLLSAMGVGAQGSCQTCQFPIPSSPAIGAGAGAAPVPSSPAPPVARPTRTASAPAPGLVGPASTPPSTAAPTSPPPTVEASYSAIPAGGGFTGQVTVVNQGATAISDWQLVVALPGDSVSAVQNAEFTDDNDVLFLSPAPYDLSIAPGSSVTVSIYASGPESTPAECSFNDVACQ
jgi:cellulose binding protein with CBM2 domain